MDDEKHWLDGLDEDFPEPEKKVLKQIKIAGDLLLIEFTDGTRRIFAATHSWEITTIEERVEKDLELFELHGLGLISQEEYERRHAAEEQGWREKREQRERAEYERLKAKFESQ